MSYYQLIEKLAPVLSERSEVTKRNPAFKQKHKIMAGKLSAVRLPACAEASAGRRRLSVRQLADSRGDFLAAASANWRSEMRSD